jgi:hypothetical protein
VSSYLPKYVMPAALVSAVAIALSWGVSLAQAAPMSGRAAGVGLPAAGPGGTNVGLVVASAVILAIVLGGIVYAIVSDRRLETSSTAAAQPTPLSDAGSEPERRKAA